MTQIQAYEASWSAGIQSILNACGEAPVEMGGELILQLHDAIFRAPAQLRSILGDLIERSRMEEFLACGAEESAALQMMRGCLGYMMSRSPTGNTMITISIAGSESEHSYVAPSALLAFVGALSELSLGLLQVSHPDGDKLGSRHLN